MVMAASQNYITVLLLRLLIGAFIAGLAPGIIYFSTFWYRLQERSVRMSLIMASTPLGAAFGGSVAYGVGSLNGVRGLEGAPACLLAIFVFLFLPAYPENATWLSDDDHALAIRRMKHESSKSVGHAKITWDGAKSTLKDGRLYLHYLFAVVSFVLSAAIGLFTPTIVSGLGYQGRNAQLFVIPLFAATSVGTVGLSAVADKYRAWSMCVLLSQILAGVTFIAQGILSPTAFKARYTLLCFGSMFAFMHSGAATAWFTGNLRDTNATTLAIAISTTVTLAGQVIACTQLLRTIYKRRNKKLQTGQNPWIV
ncbi:MFS transporter [Desarmillaria tabescens]|uniref:MFS transporter n=1 Tax=Armillaria tabescens TaxID=1929756 RepID=A0AA39JHG3_ARMTA|nr:MFS transporter [Desarmillaria tabescens]KAK0442035.1 MFS transporter [Desarmillaria tabescens]